jgi:hypothetical protein
MYSSYLCEYSDLSTTWLVEKPVLGLAGVGVCGITLFL